MSLERRKPFAPLHPNAKPTDPVLAPHSAPPHPAISRPRRQMQQYYHHQPHQQYNPHRRYATVLPGSSRSSATSSAESVYSTANSIPTRRRKLSAAEDVAARVRARWAALEALERTSSAPGPVANPADTISATNNTNTAATATATTTANATSNTAIRNGSRIRRDSHANHELRHHNWAGLEPRERDQALLLEMSKEREKENERSMSMAMQVDGPEKPLPPRPAPLSLALHLNPGQGPLSAPAHMSNAPTMAMMMTPMAVDTQEENKKGSAAREDDYAGAGAGAGGGETSDSTLRTTPTSLTCYETTESQRPNLQRRPTRALTPPQVRRRPSITNELEEAREEATLAMLQTSRTDGLLRCPRRGCNELLFGVRALTFHLHIHAVGAGAYACVRCGGAFESARELTRHACARRRARERLRSVVRAWTCLSLTNQGFGTQQPWQPQQQQQAPSKHYKRKDDNNYY